MELQILQTIEAMNACAGEWNALAEKSASHVPFLRHEYLSTWFQTLGGGEWAQGQLYVITARGAGGELKGIAPLFLTQNLAGEVALMFLGSIEISDYLDFIARPADLSSFLEALLGHLTGSQAPAWQVLDFYNLPDNSPSLEALRVAADHWGLRYTQTPLQPAPHILLPDDWETYLASLEKKQRHEIRRKIRRAESAEEGMRWYFVEDEAELDDGVDAFLQLMVFDPGKQKFLTEAMRTQMRASVHAAFRAGWLQLAFLEIGGVKTASYLNFDYANQIWVYNSGLNFDYGYYSPGWVLLAYLLQWAIEHGRTAFDFMRGDEDYKYRFGGQNRFVQRVELRR